MDKLRYYLKVKREDDRSAKLKKGKEKTKNIEKAFTLKL
jgi:hypothetical protein